MGTEQRSNAQARLVPQASPAAATGFTRTEKRDDVLLDNVEARALAECRRALTPTGQVTPVIDRTYPLDEAADALRYVGAGHTRGKVVVTI